MDQLREHQETDTRVSQVRVREVDESRSTDSQKTPLGVPAAQGDVSLIDVDAADFARLDPLALAADLHLYEPARDVDEVVAQQPEPHPAVLCHVLLRALQIVVRPRRFGGARK